VSDSDELAAAREMLVATQVIHLCAFYQISLELNRFLNARYPFVSAVLSYSAVLFSLQ